MSRLFQRMSRHVSADRQEKSHRISGEDVESRFEIAGHVCLYDFTNVWFLLNVCGENGVPEELCLDGRARQACKRTERAVDGDIAWSNELCENLRVVQPL